MKDIYEIIVADKLFKKIDERKTAYYVFVNDKARKSYKEENILTFKNKETEEAVDVKILKFYYFASVKELVEMIGKQNLGYTPSVTKDMIEDSYIHDYKFEDIEKYGLVVVNFEKI